MKRLDFSLLLCLSAMAVQAHVYDPIAYEGKSWQCMDYQNHVTEFRIHGDTIINGVEYKKAQTRVVTEEGENKWRDFAAVRDAARRTYIIYTDGGWYQQRFAHLADPVTGEILLHDFSLGGMNVEGYMGGRHVGAGGAVNVMSGGKERRRIFFWTIGTDVIDGYQLIEGIGVAPFPCCSPFRPYADGGGFDDMKCYLNGELLYDSFETELEELQPSGDANGDGMTDIDDVSVIINAIVGHGIPENAWDDVSAGVHKDGPDIDHVNLIINRILGINK